MWRVDSRIRATADVDANWRAGEAHHLGTFLDQVTVGELDDRFTFDIGDTRPLRGLTKRYVYSSFKSSVSTLLDAAPSS
ncbi:MAG: hypothetical protein ACRDQA_20465 [Nocardioidaceae bacterium]